MRNVVMFCLAMVAVPCVAFAVPVSIDSFDNNGAGVPINIGISAPGTVFGSDTGIATGTMFGARDIADTVTASGGGQLAVAVNTGAGSGGLYSHNAQTNVFGHSFAIWDGGTDHGYGTNAGSIDLTAGGTNHSITIRTLTSDHDVVIRVFLRDATVSTFADFFITSAAATGASFSLPMSSWAGVNFTNIKGGAMLILGDSIEGLDVALDYIEADNTVPEPSTLLLLGAGILGVGIATRIRRKA